MPPHPSSRAAAPSRSLDMLLALGVILFGLGVGGWYLWQEQHAAISAIAMNVMHGEMRFAHIFTNRYDSADAQVLAARPDKVTFDRLVHLAHAVGGFYLVPAIGVALALAALCAARAAASRFSRSLDLDGLIREQVVQFRSPAAFASRHCRLSGVAVGDPRPADPALNSEEWIARYATDDGRFAEIKAREELSRQLGAPWSAPMAAEAHVRCLVAAIALYGAQRRFDALALLGDLSESLALRGKEGADGPLDALTFPAAVVARADLLLREEELMAPVLDVMRRHAFTTPALMSGLRDARLRSGVLPPAQFGFLKLVDRRLWYALHSLGFPSNGLGAELNPSPRMEAIGARDHWAAECAVGAPLPAPSIDRAIAAVRAAAMGGV